MKWAIPKPSGNEPRRPLRRKPERIYDDFNDSFEERKGNCATKAIGPHQCEEEVEDILDAERRLADPNDGVSSFDELRRELGM
jgi:hypothetical protein